MSRKNRQVNAMAAQSDNSESHHMMGDNEPIIGELVAEEIENQGDTIDDRGSIGEVTAVSVAKEFEDITDLGRKFATHADRDGVFVAWAFANIPNYPDRKKIDNKYRDQFKNGTFQRYAELHPPVGYMELGIDQYRKAESQENPAFLLSVDYAVSLPTHTFGTLLPNKKALVKPLRDDANKYGDIRWGRLIKAGEDSLAKQSGTRESNKSFKEYLDKVFVDMTRKNKTAASRGDTTAWDNDTLRAAIKTFQESESSETKSETKST